MNNKKRNLAVLWLILIMMVFVYTDRNEYTWSFDADNMGRILASEEQAREAQQAAQALMEQERAAARERTAQGLWGKALDVDEYEDWTAARPAQDEEYGLNLMWGAYEVRVRYASSEALQMRMVSAGMQSFIEGGAVRAQAGEEEVSFRFTLTDSARRVRLCCSLPEGAQITQVIVHKMGAGVFSFDLAAYAALAGLVLSVLLALCWDRSADGVKRRRDAMILVGVAAFASMPVFWNGVYDGHDLLFHLNRIEGIASGLRAGQFPVRIHASTLLGYGYAASEFYPELFLYFPAVLRNLGVSLSTSVCVFEMALNLATAFVAYESAKAIFGDRDLALGTSMLYTLCVYRLVNLYVRATMGESLAMVFFPLLVWAMVEVLTRDERKWPLLTLAMLGIFMSHLLSTLFAAAFCALAAVCCLRRLVREKGRLLACAKAALLMVLCSLWFLLPMVTYTRSGISTNVAVEAWENVLNFGSLLVTFPQAVPGIETGYEDFAAMIGVVPGMAIMLGCALLLVRRYARGRGESGEKQALAFLLLGAAALIGATDLFPWERLCHMRRPISTIFRQMQFPWRLVGIAAPLLSLAAAWGYLGDARNRRTGFALLTAFCLLLGGYAMKGTVDRGTLFGAEDFCDTRVKQFEYTYPSTEKSALEPGRVLSETGELCAVTDYEKRGTCLSFTLNGLDGGYIEVPLLYYPGYWATVDGKPCTVAKGENNVVRLYIAPCETDAQVCIGYAAQPSWIAAQAASAVGLALLGMLLWRMRRRKKA